MKYKQLQEIADNQSVKEAYREIYSDKAEFMNWMIEIDSTLDKCRHCKRLKERKRNCVLCSLEARSVRRKNSLDEIQSLIEKENFLENLNVQDLREFKEEKEEFNRKAKNIKVRNGLVTMQTVRNLMRDWEDLIIEFEGEQ